MKRYPTSKVRERNPSEMVGVARGHQRADTLKTHTTALISDIRKVMLKILQARLQQYMN